MKTRGGKMADGGSQTRSVWECGSPLPLSAARSWDAIESAGGMAPSQTWRSCVAALGLLLSIITSPLSTAPAQSYSINWHTIDGGGGTSTGGVYSVSGTMGQPEAGGPMTNGQYAVTGGFWSLPKALQVFGAPTLTIVPAALGNATISWSPNPPGFVLQETLSLAPTNWVNSASGATNPIVVPANVPAKFYRLFKL